MSNLRIIGNLLVWKANPQDIAYSTAWLGFGFLLHATADVVSLLGVLSVPAAIAAAILDTVLIVALIHTSLMWRGRGNRAVQALTGILACGGVLGLSAWILSTVLAGIVPVEWVWLPFVVWFVAVFAHVVRHALEVPLSVGVIIGFAYLVLSSGVTALFLDPKALP